MKIILQETFLYTIVFTIWVSIVTVRYWGLGLGYAIPFLILFILFFCYFYSKEK